MPPSRRACAPTPRLHAGKTIFEEYITEYSTDKIEMHDDAVKPGQRVLLVNARGGLGVPTGGL